MRLWAVMCSHKRKEWFWGIKTSSVKGWMVQVEGGHEEQLCRSLVHPTPSACSWAPQEKSNHSLGVLEDLLSWETPCDPCCQHRISAHHSPWDSAVGSPLPATHPELPLGHFLPLWPRLEQFFSCLASGEEQAPAVRSFNTLYYTPNV